MFLEIIHNELEGFNKILNAVEHAFTAKKITYRKLEFIFGGDDILDLLVTLKQLFFHIV